MEEHIVLPAANDWRGVFKGVFLAKLETDQGGFRAAKGLHGST